MINQEFDHIVGVGGHCQTAHQIRRQFNVDKAYPFDWWVTPTIGLVELLETGFEDIFREENMKIVLEKSGPAVTCSRYRLMHYHDFDEAKISGEYWPYLVRSLCARNNSKFSYLVTRFLNLSGKVLLIRHSLGWTEFDDRVCTFDGDLIARFGLAIKRPLPNAEVTLLLLDDFNSYAGVHGRYNDWVYSSTLNTYGDITWSGSDKGWAEMFVQQKISLKPAMEKIRLTESTQTGPVQQQKPQPIPSDAIMTGLIPSALLSL